MNNTKNSGRRMQLFCIPFAGGNKNSFSELSESISDDIEVIILDYPGHGTRMRERFGESIEELVEDMYNQIVDKRNEQLNFAVLGYSMGSIVVYELLRYMYLNGKEKEIPKKVILCANECLLNYGPRVNFNEMSKDQVTQKLISMGGIDERILANERFLKIFLRVLEADYKILCNYEFKQNSIIPMSDALILYSEKDTSYEQVKNWTELFGGKVEFSELGNNHFFIFTEAVKMANEINRFLLKG